MNTALAELRKRLKLNLQTLERSSDSIVSSTTYIPTAFPELNQLLPGGGWPLGSIIEVLSGQNGCGAFSFALAAARPAMENKAAWAVVDTESSFYPPAVAALGLDLEKLIVIRTPVQHAPWAFNQLLRCSEIGAAFLNAPKIENMACRRLQLAAERGGSLGFLLRPLSAIKKPCWASVRLMVERLHQDRLQVTLLRVRGGNLTRQQDFEVLGQR